MKVTCPISGVRYILSNPLRGHAIHPHPMLSSTITIAQLNDWYLKDWAEGNLASDLTHLLGMAYVIRLPIESANLPVADEFKLEKYDNFWSGILEDLAKVATKLEGRNKQFKRLPRFMLNAETLRRLPDWLADLKTEMSVASMPISEKAKELNRESYKTRGEISAQTISSFLTPEQTDGVVLRALRESPLAKGEAKALPVILADWANKVTEFPQGQATRWQRIIQTIFNENYIDQIIMTGIKVVDIKQIEEHVMLNTPSHAVGTSHSKLLMARIATVIPVIEMFDPQISARKKGNEDELLATIMGNNTSERAQPGTTHAQHTGKSNHANANGSNNSSNPANKTMTLTERLAARMANMGKK